MHLLLALCLWSSWTTTHSGGDWESAQEEGPAVVGSLRGWSTGQPGAFTVVQNHLQASKLSWFQLPSGSLLDQQKHLTAG